MRYRTQVSKPSDCHALQGAEPFDRIARDGFSFSVAYFTEKEF